METLKKQINRIMYRDGLLELLLGSFLLAFGLMFFYLPRLAPFSIFVIFLLKPLAAKLKEKYVFPRAGYVKPSDENEKEVQGIVVTAVLSFVLMVVTLVVLVLLKGAQAGKLIFMRWVFPPMSGILFAFGPFWMGMKFGLRRGFIMAGLLPATGIFLGFSGLATGYRAVGVLCMVAGLFAATSGTVLFNRFISRNPLPEGSNE